MSADQPLPDERKEALAQKLAIGLSRYRAGQAIGVSSTTSNRWGREAEVVARAVYIKETSVYVPTPDQVIAQAWLDSRAAAQAGQYKAALDGMKWVHAVVKAQDRPEQTEGEFDLESDLELLKTG